MLNPDFKDMLSCLKKEKVDFLVVGAYALAAHGLPRATGDLDFNIGLLKKKRLRNALWEAGLGRV